MLYNEWTVYKLDNRQKEREREKLNKLDRQK